MSTVRVDLHTVVTGVVGISVLNLPLTVDDTERRLRRLLQTR